MSRSTAIHESSHAVLALHFGYRVTEIVLDGVSGYCQTTEPEKLVTSQQWSQHLSISISGIVGELMDDEREQGICATLVSVYGESGSDLAEAQQAAKSLSALTGKCPRDLIEQAERRCKLILKSRWHHVQKLADELLAKNRLTESDITRLIQIKS